MKRIVLTATLLLVAIAGFTQAEKKNGTIYINHPYIDVVLKSSKAYVANDVATNKTFFADTARFGVTGMPKMIKIDEALKMWSSHFKYYDSINVRQDGYPDYLHYVDGDAKIVQSWWTWSGRSKKTGEKLRIMFVQFNTFNKDGKITEETLYGDFSKMESDPM
jgi:hypothetical protein